MTDPPKAKPRPRRRRTDMPQPPREPAGDFDLANGRFRLDLRTVLLLAALLGSWYDSRQQQQLQATQERADREKQAAVDQVQTKAVADALGEVKRLQMAQAYDVRQIIVALAERGIVIKETK